jgi:hypothetical protein
MSFLDCTLHRKACCYVDQNKEDKIDGMHNDNEVGAEFVQNFSRKTTRVESTWETKA